MIDFRYHVVSLVAVFLALAVGIVLGSTVLDNVVLEGTKKTANNLKTSNDNLRDQLLALQARQRSDQDFVKTMGPSLLKDQLAGRRVVLVAAPGADTDAVAAVSGDVKQAGGSITGTVSLSQNYVDKNHVGELGGLTETLAKSSKIQVPSGSVASQQAAILLGRALLAKEKGRQGKSDDTAQGILDAFAKAGFLTKSGSPDEQAGLAILVGPAQPYAPKVATLQNQALVQLAGQLDASGDGSVLSGPTSSADGDGVVAALRDSDEKSTVSSVDTLDAAAGPLTTALALAYEDEGKTGQWGSGSGAGGVVPTPSASTPSRPAKNP